MHAAATATDGRWPSVGSMAGTSTPVPPKIRLHPNMAGLYREKVASLEEALADPVCTTRSRIVGMPREVGKQQVFDSVLHLESARSRIST